MMSSSVRSHLRSRSDSPLSIPADQACERLDYRPQSVLFEDKELSGAAGGLLSAAGIQCGVLEAADDAARFIGQVSARMLAQGLGRAGDTSTMPGVLSRRGVASSDAVPGDLAAELWRTATLLRAVRANARVHWHRMSFRVALEEQLQVPGGGLRVRPQVFWSYVDETEGHRAVIRRSGAAQVGGSASGSDPDAGAGPIALMAPLRRPVVLAPDPREDGMEEPTVYVLTKRWDLEQMVMASADEEKEVNGNIGTGTGLAQAVPHVLDQVCACCGKTRWELSQPSAEDAVRAVDGAEAGALHADGSSKSSGSPVASNSGAHTERDDGVSMGRCSLCKSVYYCCRVCQEEHFAEHKKRCRPAAERSRGEPKKPEEAVLCSYQLAPSLPFEDLDAIEGLGLQPWRVSQVERANAIRDSTVLGPNSGSGSSASALSAESEGHRAKSTSSSESVATDPLALLEGFPMLAKMQGTTGRARLTALDCVRLLVSMRAMLFVLLCEKRLMRP